MTGFTSREAPGTLRISPSFLPKISEDQKRSYPLGHEALKCGPWHYAMMPYGKSSPGWKNPFMMFIAQNIKNCTKLALSSYLSICLEISGLFNSSSVKDFPKRFSEYTIASIIPRSKIATTLFSPSFSKNKS